MKSQIQYNTVSNKTFLIRMIISKLLENDKPTSNIIQIKDDGTRTLKTLQNHFKKLVIRCQDFLRHH